jgi:hypothetical protein
MVLPTGQQFIHFGSFVYWTGASTERGGTVCAGARRIQLLTEAAVMKSACLP